MLAPNACVTSTPISPKTSQIRIVSRYRCALAMIAHDTRSPLATIQSAAELLQELIRSEERDVEKLLRFSSIIERTAGRALDNIDDLLAGVRGEQERAQSSVDIKDLVHDVALQLEGALRSRDVHFETILNYEGDLLCDRRQLTRALVNLLRNALDAVPDGGTVELTVDREAESVVFAVRDTGCGIPVELQGRIFERRFTHGKKAALASGSTRCATPWSDTAARSRSTVVPMRAPPFVSAFRNGATHSRRGSSALLSAPGGTDSPPCLRVATTGSFVTMVSGERPVADPPLSAENIEIRSESTVARHAAVRRDRTTVRLPDHPSSKWPISLFWSMPIDRVANVF
jgi:hypothetical protein